MPHRITNILSFNTQPPEGGCWWRKSVLIGLMVSTHSRLKAADVPAFWDKFDNLFQHTAA